MLDHDTSSSGGGALFPTRLAKVRTSNGKPSNSTRFGPFDLKPGPGNAAEAGGWRGLGDKSNGLNLVVLEGFPLRVHLFRKELSELIVSNVTLFTQMCISHHARIVPCKNVPS